MIHSNGTLADGERRPRFSILIPTRDRPAYVKNALESALNQTFRDFEVVVSDNFVEKSCEAEVRSVADPRVRYVRPPEPLAMHDHWEFAIDQARGDFVLILIDKTLLRLNALERLEAATKSHPTEVYSWTADAYYLTHEQDGDAGRGYLVPVRSMGEPFYVDARRELADRASFRQRIGTEGPAYNYGKICFGAFSRDLIARIKARFGKVCPLVSPDYTSKTTALLSTDRLVDMGGSFGFNVMTSISNGMKFAQSSGHARRFLAQGGFKQAEFAALPIPHVFCSYHNICAYDLRMLADVACAKSDMNDAVDLAALYVLVEQDVANVQDWASEDERKEVLGHMQEFLRKAPIELRNRIIDQKIAFTEADLAAREKAVIARETYVKFREDTALNRETYVLGRENTVLGRENNVLGRENNVLGRENAVNERELFVSRLEQDMRRPIQAYNLARRIKSRGMALMQGGAVQATAISMGSKIAQAAPDAEIARPHPTEASITSAQAKPQPAAETVGGFPVFASTLSALRYAETAFYVFPTPVPPPVTP